MGYDKVSLVKSAVFSFLKYANITLVVAFLIFTSKKCPVMIQNNFHELVCFIVFITKCFIINNQHKFIVVFIA